MTDYFLIGELKSAHSSNGFISLVFFLSDFDKFLKIKNVYINVFGAYRLFKIEDVKLVSDNICLKFKNFNSDNDIDFLIGKKIYTEKKNLASLSEDTYFVSDLVGSKVFLKSKFFGYLIDVLNLPANDVYVIKDDDDNEIMVPAVKEFIDNVDIDDKILVLKKVT